MKEEGRGKKEEGRRKREEGRGKEESTMQRSALFAERLPGD